MKNIFRSRKIVPIQYDSNKQVRATRKAAKKRKYKPSSFQGHPNSSFSVKIPNRFERSSSGGWLSHVHIEKCVDLTDIKRLVKDDLKDLKEKMNKDDHRASTSTPRGLLYDSLKEALRKDYNMQQSTPNDVKGRKLEKSDALKKMGEKKKKQKKKKKSKNRKSESPEKSKSPRDLSKRKFSYYDTEEVDILDSIEQPNSFSGHENKNNFGNLVRQVSSSSDVGVFGYEQIEKYPLELAKVEEKYFKRKIIPLANECNNCFQHCHGNFHASNSSFSHFSHDGRNGNQSSANSSSFCSSCICDECSWRKTFVIHENKHIESENILISGECHGRKVQGKNDLLLCQPDFNSSYMRSFLSQFACTATMTSSEFFEKFFFFIRTLFGPLFITTFTFVTGFMVYFYSAVIQEMYSAGYFWIFTILLILSSVLNLIYIILDCMIQVSTWAGLIEENDFIDFCGRKSGEKMGSVYFFLISILLFLSSIFQVLIIFLYIFIFSIFMFLPITYWNSIRTFFNLFWLPENYSAIGFDYLFFALFFYPVLSIITYYLLNVSDLSYWMVFKKWVNTKKMSLSDTVKFINTLKFKGNPAISLGLTESWLQSISSRSFHSDPFFNPPGGRFGGLRHRSKYLTCKFDFVKDYTLEIDESYLRSSSRKPIVIVNVYKAYILSDKSVNYLKEMEKLIKEKSKFVKKHENFRKNLILYLDGEKMPTRCFEKILISQNKNNFFAKIFEIFFSKFCTSTFFPFLFHPLIARRLFNLFVDVKNVYICKGVYFYKSIVTTRKYKEMKNCITWDDLQKEINLM